MDNSDVWIAINDISEKMLLSKIRINKSLVEEALSFDPNCLAEISDDVLRKYLIVLGQFLMTIQYEENTLDAIRVVWSKSLDNEMMVVMGGNSGVQGKTITEKKAWVLFNDEACKDYNNQFLVAEAKYNIMKNMGRSIEQYINTIKKEVDARESEKSRNYR
jgi:hypothetical protein